MANQGYWEKSRTHQFVALVKRLLRPSNLVATNLPQAGYVPSVGADDQFTWVAGGGGGGQVDTIVPGDGIDVDSTDPINPIVSAFLSTGVGNAIVFGTDGGLYDPGGSGSSEFGFEVAFDGGGAILTTGALTAGAATMPQAGTIDTVTVTATPGTTPTVSIAVYRSTYAAYPTGTLIHTATLTAAQKTQTTGLSIAITAGDQIWGEVLSNVDCVGITVAGTGT